MYSFSAYSTLKLTEDQKQIYRSFDVYDTESKTYKELVVDQTLSTFDHEVKDVVPLLADYFWKIKSSANKRTTPILCSFQKTNFFLDDEIQDALRIELGKEFVSSFVVGLRLSDRYKDTIEVDFVIFLKRETASDDGWNKKYTALNVSSFSSFTVFEFHCFQMFIQLGVEVERIFNEYTPGAGKFQFQTRAFSTGVQDMDECAVKAHNNCHPENADCINEEGTFTCRCKPGHKDTGGPMNPGRQCPNQCKPNPCKHGTCLRTNEVGDPVCMCPSDYRGKFCEEQDPLHVLPEIGASVRTSSRLVLIVVTGFILILALPLFCCCCCFCCPVRKEIKLANLLKWLTFGFR